ncbi:[FeFe] hydrogenase H-cluster radical SAM maturase HydG [Phaeospirillum tilakii]|uniref:[FeFe] hydrogenase H-cluster radical SAM maturase HydG n=1 Tax=Phaeospirillum tilakii TaxID=741673 RepID=A0ABW5C9T7_9PROT
MTHASPDSPDWLDAARLQDALDRHRREDAGRIAEILAKARELKGLDGDEVAALAALDRPDLLAELFATARAVKEAIYGRRMVFFAPLYISNLCGNECLYCAFRASNNSVIRHTLNQEEIAREVEILIEQGHKRVLMVAGESYRGGFEYVLDSIATIYSVKRANGAIRRVNANLAPLTVDQFRALHGAGIGTYQLFQETYHRETYAACHPRGQKADFNWRVTAFDRAMEAGIDDVGMGVLFGLADWRFEVLALMSHIAHLEERFGVGCHTISVPRLEPAIGSAMATHPPVPVSDADFKKLVAILRLAVPYTGLIMSTRESAAMRRETYALGVSQISAGSRTNPGGYAAAEQFESSQFQLGDHRSLEEVVQDIAAMGYIPSFCTACYRVGRTGGDFMDLAKTGDIKAKCAPNAVGTFLEYLLDYAGPDTLAEGERRIAAEIAAMAPEEQRVARRLADMVRAGKRDVFC